MTLSDILTYAREALLGMLLAARQPTPDDPAGSESHIPLMAPDGDSGDDGDWDWDWDDLSEPSASPTLAPLPASLDSLRYSRENGCPWYDFPCAYAAQGGLLGGSLSVTGGSTLSTGRDTASSFLDCLRYVHETSPPPHRGSGILDCLRYVHETDGFLPTSTSCQYRLPAGCMG